MPRIISSHEKLAVIDDWLSGESRMDIARKRNMGSGTVYNIIKEWRIGIGIQQADRLRDLALILTKTRLTVTECADGLRTLMVFKKYGIKEDEDHEQLVYFLKDIYTRCQEVGVTPQLVFDYISEILKLSSEISISEIPQFIKQKIKEKEKLEKEGQELFNKKYDLIGIKKEIEQEIEELRKNKDTMTKTYQTFTIAKSRLVQYGIGMENIDQFVNCVVGISKERYDHVQVLAKITDYERLKEDSKYYKSEVDIMTNVLAELNKEIDDQKNNLNYMIIKVEIINELEYRGFGITELRILINIINEIGLEHKQDYDEIRKVFFEDVKKNYGEVIGSRKEIDRLKKELKILEELTMKEREKYNSYPKVIESIRRLAGSRISEEDIVYIDKILSMTDYYNYKDKRLYKEGLIDDLQKYGNLTLAIRNLENEKENIKSKKKTQNKSMKKKKTSTVNKTTGK